MGGNASEVPGCRDDAWHVGTFVSLTTRDPDSRGPEAREKLLIQFL